MTSAANRFSGGILGLLEPAARNQGGYRHRRIIVKEHGLVNICSEEGGFERDDPPTPLMDGGSCLIAFKESPGFAPEFFGNEIVCQTVLAYTAMFRCPGAL